MKNMMKRILSLVWALCLLLSNFGEMVSPVFGSDGAALETELTASDGHTYSITVCFDEATGVPENTELQVKELQEGGSLYDAYVSQSTELLEAEEEYLNLAKAFDITLRNTVTGEEFQPESSVRVSIRLMDVDSLEDLGDVNVVHFGDEAPEVLSSEVEGDSVNFETESFSVYVVTAGQSTLCTYYFYTYDSFGNYAAYTFFDDHGNYVPSQTIKNGETLIAPHNFPVDPNNPNAEFMGWYVGIAGEDAPDLTKPFDFSIPQDIVPHVGTEEVHLYAVFAGYLYASFHGQYDSDTNTFPVLQTVRMQIPENGDATVDLSQYTAPWYNTATEGNSTFPRYTFYGWSTVGYQVAGSGHDAVLDAANPYAFSKNIDFYPLYEAVNWLSFASGASGTGATYFSPVAVKEMKLGQSVFEAHIPEREGYAFQGWYLDVENLGNVQQNGSGSKQITDATGKLVSVKDVDKGIESVLHPDSGEPYIWLNQDLTIYAKWEAQNVPYTVVTWKQRADGTGYDWAESFSLEALPYASVTAAAEYKTKDYAGYTYRAAISDDGAKEISYEGNTVFNLYYDLNLGEAQTASYTVVIWKQRSDGENYDYAESITVSGATPFAETAAPEEYKTKNYPGYAYNQSKSDGETEPLLDAKGRLQYDTAGKILYSGKKVIGLDGSTVFNLYYDYESAPAGLGEGTFELTFKFPVTKPDNSAYNPADGEYEAVSGTDIVTDNLPAKPEFSGYAFFWFADPGYTARVFFDQTSYDAYAGTKVLYTVMPDHDQTFYGSWVKEHKLYFGEDTENPETCLTGAPSTSVTLPAAPSDKEGYEYHWYADEGGTARVFFDRLSYYRYTDGPKVLYAAMPDHDLTVYGGWEKEWYLIKINPNGGEMKYDIVYYDGNNQPVEEEDGVTRKHEASVNATYFWKTYMSDYVQEYSWITRDYVESESGTWFYANHDVSYNGDPDRLTYYTDRIEEATGLTTYKYAPGAYVSNGWYEQADGTEKPYDFGEPITGNLSLKLHWKLSDTFFLQFNGNVTLDGEKLNGTVSSVNPAVPSEDGYADQAKIMLNCSAEAPEGYTFVGWTVRGDENDTLYYPGSDFVLPGEYAVMMNGKKTVFLDAVYVRIRTAKIVYNANGGALAEGADAGSPVDSGTPYFVTRDAAAGTVTLEALVNNSRVQLADGSGFTRPEGTSWELVGWNTEKDGSGDSFKLGVSEYQDEENVTHYYYVHVDESVTLYAQWAVPVYFDKNEANYPSAVFDDVKWSGFTPVSGRYCTVVYINALVPEPDLRAVKINGDDSYVLKFWSTTDDPNGEPAPFDFAHTHLEDGVTLYAHYEVAVLVPFHVVSGNHVLWDSWKNTEYLRVSTAGITMNDSALKDYLEKADGYTYSYACLSADENGISSEAGARVTSIAKTGEGAVATLADGSTSLLDGEGRDAEGRMLYLVYVNEVTDNRLKLAYVRESSSGALSPVQGAGSTDSNVKITYNEADFDFLNGTLVTSGVLSSKTVANGAITGEGESETVAGQVLTLGAEPLEISQRTGSGIFNAPPMLDNKEDLPDETLTLVYDDAALGAAGAANVSGVSEPVRKQFLRYYDGQRQWSADGEKWTTLDAAVDTLYIIYRERGNELHITGAITETDTGISPDMSFKVTLTSTAIIRSSYKAEGTGYSTVDATPATDTTPGQIVLRVKEGSEINIIGLGNGEYTMTVEYNSNYALKVKTKANGVTGDAETTPVTGGSSLSFNLNRVEKQLDLEFEPSPVCAVERKTGGGLIRFYTLNRAIEYIKTDWNGEKDIQLIQDYTVPDWDVLEIPFGFNVTLMSFAEIEDGQYKTPESIYTLTRDREFTNGPVVDNYGSLTLHWIVLDGQGLEVKAPMVRTDSQLTVEEDTTLKNANRVGSGGMIEQESGTLTVNGGAFLNNSATLGGGAIYVQKGLMTVTEGSTFDSNGKYADGEGNILATTEKGGAIYYAGINTLDISGGVFKDNFASLDGGAIYAEGGAITVSGGSFKDNGKYSVVIGENTVETRTEKGGALYMEIAALTLEGGDFTANTASEDGGAIYAQAGEIKLIEGKSEGEKCTLTENLAGRNGGAIFIAGSTSTLDLVNGILTKNKAGKNGGVIFVDSGILSMTGGQIGGSSDQANEAAYGAGVFIRAGTGNFSGGKITYNKASGGGAVSVGDDTAHLYFSGKPTIRYNTLSSGQTCNVYLDRDSQDVLNITGTGLVNNNDCYIGIYVADKYESEETDGDGNPVLKDLLPKRGIPGARFASYTNNSNSGRMHNDRDTDFAVVSDTSTRKFYWGKSIKVQVWYQSAAFETAGYPPYSTKETSTLKRKKSSYSYDPIIGEDGEVSLSALAANVYNTNKLGLTDTAAFAGAYKSTATSFADYATKLKWDMTGKKWVIVKHDGSTEDLNDKDLLIYYAEPAYITIENNTGTDDPDDPGRKLTISGLTVGTIVVDGNTVNRSLINTTDYAGYGMTFAVNGFIRSDLLPIENQDLVLNPGTSVTLLIPGGQDRDYTLTGSFAPGIAENVRLRTTNPEGTEADPYFEDELTVAANGSFTFPTGKKTLSGKGTYQIIFGGEKYICKVGGHNCKSISEAIQYIQAHRDEFADSTYIDGKAATIEMMVDYLVPSSDPVDIPAGYDITLTTWSGYETPAGSTDNSYTADGVKVKRATLSRDSQNPNPMLRCSDGEKNARFVVKNLIIDGKSVQGSSDGGAISTRTCRLIVDHVVFKNVYALNGGAIYATDYSEADSDYNNTDLKKKIQGEGENTTKTYSYVKVTNSVFYDCICNKPKQPTHNRVGGGAIHAYVDQLVVENCSFEKCTAITQAGAVFHRVDNDKCYSIAEITGCTFKNCSSQAAGGLELDSRWIIVKGCSFEHCVATERNGGGFNVYALNNGNPGTSYTIVQDCSFNDCFISKTSTNASNGNGGGFRSNSKYTQIINTTFNNTSATYGGAIGLSNTNADKAEIYGCTINDGRAEDSGGGIRCTAKTLIIDDAYSYDFMVGGKTVTVLVFKSGDKYYSMAGTEVDTSRYTPERESNGKYYYSYERATGGTVKVEVRESEGKYYTVWDAEVDTSVYTVNFVGHSSITYCRAKKGGGIYQIRDTGGTSLTVRNATVSHNQTTGGNGGGIEADAVRSVSVIGSTISNNIASGNGGGICVGNTKSSQVVIDSTSITGNTSGGIGGGIYSNTALTLRNGTRITGNLITTNPSDMAANAAGVFMENSKILTVGMTKDEFKAAYKIEHPLATDEQVNKAWAEWTDDTTVMGNTTASNSPSDLRLWWDEASQNNNANSVSALCSLSGKIYVVNPGAATTQFGVRTGEAAGFTVAQHVFEGDGGGIYGVVDREDTKEKKLIWRGGEICKITDASGKLLYLDKDCKDPAVFDLLDDYSSGSKLSPFSYLRLADHPLYREGSTVPVTPENGICIKLLDAGYEVTAPLVTPIEPGWNITLTTAGKMDVDYPYRGRSGTYATLKRVYDGESMIVSGVNLTLQNITLDGDSTLGSRYATGNGGLVRAETAGTSLTLGQNATLQNSQISGEGNGSGIYVKSSDDSSVSLFIRGGILYNCAAPEGSGGGVYFDSPAGQFEFTRGNISRCSAKNGGGIYLAEVNSKETDAGKKGFLMSTGAVRISDCAATEKGGGVYLSKGMTMRMDGGFITNNSAEEAGGGIYMGYAEGTGEDGTRVVFSGRVTVSGNTCTAAVDKRGKACNNDVQLDKDSNAVIRTTGLSRNSSIGIYVSGSTDDQAADYAAGNYSKHGEENDPFGHYEGDTTYLYCFVNNRNGLKGGLKQNLSETEAALHNIYWVKVFSLEVKKTVISGEEYDLGEYFSFTVTFSNSLNGAADPDYSCAYVINRTSDTGDFTEDGTVTAGTATFSLKNGESVSFDDMPVNLYYTVRENLTDGTGSTRNQLDHYTTTTNRSTGSLRGTTGGLPWVSGWIGEGMDNNEYASKAYFDNLNAICKITSTQNGGVLYTKKGYDYNPAVYSKLSNPSDPSNPGAFDVLNAGTELYYLHPISGEPIAIDPTDSSYTISVEMLVPNYEISNPVTVNKTVTLTTASPYATDGFPYSGGSNTATLSRKSTLKAYSLFTVAGDLTVRDITLDGNGTAVTTTTAGGLVYVMANAKLTVTTGAVLQNSRCSASVGGAAVYVGANGTATLSGNAVIQNNTCTIGSGAGIYAAANNAGGFAAVTVSGSAAIKDNTCASSDGAGAGIYLAAGSGDGAGTAKLYLSGTPTFSGNTVVKENYADKSNGPDLAYPDNKVEQDIYITEKHTGAPASVIVNGALSGTDSANPENDKGSIWVWAVEPEHYAMQKPFASIAEGVDQADVNVELFRNAQPNDVTNCGTDMYLTGQFKSTTDAKIYWTGGVDIEFIKKDGDGAPLKDAQFTLIEKSVYDSVGLSGTPEGVQSSGDDGKVLFECINYGVYILKETVVPTGYEESGPFIVVVGSENLTAAQEDNAGVFKDIHEADIKALTKNGEQFAIFPYDVSGNKALPILDSEGYYLNANTSVNGVLNYKEGKQKVILKKCTNVYDPLAGAKFDLFRADMVLVPGGKDLTSDVSGVIWIGTLSYGTYYLHEKDVPTGYAHLSDGTNWYKIVVSANGVSDPIRLTDPADIPDNWKYTPPTP